MANFSFTQITGNDIVAPGRAANSFYGVYGLNGNQTNIPNSGVQNYSYDDDTRIIWSKLQPTSDGVYVWTFFDDCVKAAITKGQKFKFGIISIDDYTPNGSYNVGGAVAGYPLFVHTAMQSEAAPDWISTADHTGSSPMWVPNWNSPTYLAAVEKFLLALADHIKNTQYTVSAVVYNCKDVIHTIDIRMFGRYGEWHNFGTGYNGSSFYSPSATRATDATLNRIIDAHVTAFPNYPLVGNIAMVYGDEISVPVGYHSLTVTNNWGKIGFRSDHLGDTGTYDFELNKMATRSSNGLNFQTEFLNRWKVAPMQGEPMNDTARTTVGSPTNPQQNFWQLETQIRNYHISQFSNTNNLLQDTASGNNIRAASKASGYRIISTGGVVGDNIKAGTPFQITMNWQNIGVAPTYENWTVKYEVRNSGTNALVHTAISTFVPKFFLPSTSVVPVTDTVTIPAAVAAGTYKINVIIVDPVGYRLPLPIAITGRNGDGSYTLGTYSVAAAGVTPPVTGTLNSFTATILSTSGSGSSLTYTIQLAWNTSNASTIDIEQRFSSTAAYTTAYSAVVGTVAGANIFLNNIVNTRTITITTGSALDAYFRIKVDGVLLGNTVNLSANNLPVVTYSVPKYTRSTYINIYASAPVTQTVKVTNFAGTVIYNGSYTFKAGQNKIAMTLARSLYYTVKIGTISYTTYCYAR